MIVVQSSAACFQYHVRPLEMLSCKMRLGVKEDQQHALYFFHVATHVSWIIREKQLERKLLQIELTK